MTKNFKLNEEEMTLAVNALASSEEYLLYRKLQVGAKNCRNHTRLPGRNR